jgi:predicted dehydrogenase
LTKERRGDVAIVAGRTDTKVETIRRLHDAGFHVLADKPWLTGVEALPTIRELLAAPPRAADIMTTRLEIGVRLMTALVGEPQIFGQFAVERDRPAILIESVHYLYKIVTGRRLVRPAWFFDIGVQGAGIVDLTTHLLDQVMSLAGAATDPALPFSFGGDATLEGARVWDTPVPRELFRRITGEPDFPAALKPHVRHGLLRYLCNGEIDCRLRGIPVQVGVVWHGETPPGGGDTTHAVLRGTRATVEMRQGPQTGFREEVHVRPKRGDRDLRRTLERTVAGWQDRLPGTKVSDRGKSLVLTYPDELRIPHEAQFSLALAQFLDNLDGDWPAREEPNLLTRYTLIAKAAQRASLTGAIQFEKSRAIPSKP